MTFNKKQPSSKDKNTKLSNEIDINSLDNLSNENLANSDTSWDNPKKIKRKTIAQKNSSINGERKFFKGFQAFKNLLKNNTESLHQEELDYDKLSADDNISEKKNNRKKIVMNGIFSNNPVFRLVLGTCPTLAVTTLAVNGLAMGLSVAFVLICSNFLISLLRNTIPDKIRIVAYIVIIATFVSIVEMLMKNFIPSLYESMGLFIPLIAVNCIILARAEAFASNNTILDSSLDGLGMRIGFTLSLTLMGIIREFLGAGAFFGLKIPFISNYAMTFFILPAGGFLTFGFIMATVTVITNNFQKKKELTLLKR